MVNQRIALVCFSGIIALAVGLGGPERALAEGAAPAAADAQVAERQARGQAAAKAFIQGRYQEALDTYLDLYLKSHGRPEYLRSIGRCQQKLNQHDLAISTLKDYLLRSKYVTAEERREVQGFIAEIEAAKASSAAADATKPAPAAAQPAPLPPPAVAPPAVPPVGPTPGDGAPPPVTPNLSPPPSSVAATDPAVVLARSEPPPPSKPAGMPALKVGGIVASIAAAVLVAGGTAMLLSARSTYYEAKDAGCPTAVAVDCGGKASSVSSANTVSKVLYVGGALAAVAGGTMLFLAPAPAGGTQVGLTTRLVF